MNWLKLNFNLGLLLCASLAAAEAPVVRVRYLMGTLCEIQAYGNSEAATKAFEEIARLEEILSTWKPDSEVSRLNREGRIEKASPELLELLKISMSLSESTQGAFDVTVKPLLDARGVHGPAREPSNQELREALALVGWRHVKIQGRSVSFAKKGMGVDFGAIGKGYALDRAAAVLKNEGIKSALLNFGGQILAFGAPPGEKAWKARLHDLEFELQNESISVSSQNEAQKSGKPLGHVFDPRTGLPASFNKSLPVRASTAAEADALSTAYLVLSSGTLFSGGEK